MVIIEPIMLFFNHSSYYTSMATSKHYTLLFVYISKYVYIFVFVQQVS